MYAQETSTKTNPNWRNELREQVIDDKDVMVSAPEVKTEQMRKKEKMSLTLSSISL